MAAFRFSKKKKNKFDKSLGKDFFSADTHSAKSFFHYFNYLFLTFFFVSVSVSVPFDLGPTVENLFASSLTPPENKLDRFVVEIISPCKNNLAYSTGGPAL
jgi:hypothetical protein